MITHAHTHSHQPGLGEAGHVPGAHSCCLCVCALPHGARGGAPPFSQAAGQKSLSAPADQRVPERQIKGVK